MATSDDSNNNLASNSVGCGAEAFIYCRLNNVFEGPLSEAQVQDSYRKGLFHSAVQFRIGEHGNPQTLAELIQLNGQWSPFCSLSLLRHTIHMQNLTLEERLARVERFMEDTVERREADHSRFVDVGVRLVKLEKGVMDVKIKEQLHERLSEIQQFIHTIQLKLEMQMGKINETKTLFEHSNHAQKNALDAMEQEYTEIVASIEKNHQQKTMAEISIIETRLKTLEMRIDTEKVKTNEKLMELEDTINHLIQGECDSMCEEEEEEEDDDDEEDMDEDEYDEESGYEGIANEVTSLLENIHPHNKKATFRDLQRLRDAFNECNKFDLNEQTREMFGDEGAECHSCGGAYLGNANNFISHITSSLHADNVTMAKDDIDYWYEECMNAP